MSKKLIAVWLASAAAQAVPVYRWVDENGRVNYSDRPGPGAVLLDLSAEPTSSNSGSPPSARQQRPLEFRTTEFGPPETQPPESQPFATAEYDAIVVTQPASGETLWGTAGRVSITVDVSPALDPRHHFGLYLDGAPAGQAFRTGIAEIGDVPRGEHVVEAVILDESRREILRSAPVTFFVQQTSIHYPRNPGRAR